MSPSLHEPAVAIETTPQLDQDDTASIRTVSTAERRPSLTHFHSHVSHGQDAPIQQYSSYVEVPDEVYDRIKPSRKVVIVALLSFCSFLAPISSTTILSAIPEVAATYHSTGTIINLSNALYMLFMGFSPCVWGPLSQVYGRRRICLITAVLFLGCSLGTALSPNLVSYYIFRILTAFEGTSFLTIGASCIGDIYRPSERATAMGWFLSGTLIGPAFGPFIGGIIVTFKSWRVIFYLQTALAGVAAVGAFFLLPETSHHMKADELVGLPLKKKAAILWGMLNPWRVVRLYQYPNLIMVALASSSLVWNMYSLLTPIRYVLNPRFNLTTPIQSGLFYLAPGCGYIAGTFFGGRYADHITIKWTKKRGMRVPEDRLRSCLPFMGIVIPACMLIYGWSIEKRFGGVSLPVIMMFCQGVAQLFCFPSLNTYCLDVMQGDAAEVIAGNYMIRYLFAALGSATVLPAVEKIGVGWFSTISAAFLVASSLATLAAVVWGKRWRDGIDTKRRAKRGKVMEGYVEKEKTVITPVIVKGKEDESV
ncbi:Itaconate transport protein [Lachnellula suecica]|uniref:Itaconate transport protein n=1 Tax=Lachnellula suecica TaxID=602035 RepID=A0A8T9CFH4_9HELO|nr:Itaconate transport protein [Lachnellula suecica]